MHRWPRTIVATGLWAFCLLGLVGLADAVVNAIIYGPPGGPGLLGPLRAMLPSFTFYGWFGLAAALLVCLPLAVRWRRRADAAGRLTAPALAFGIALVILVTVGYLIHEAAPGRWWDRHLGPLWVPVVILAALVTPLMAVPLRRPAARLAGSSWRTIAVLAAIAVVATLAWPDARAGIRCRHLDGQALGTAPAGAPNVLILSIDALRRDHLSCVDPQSPPTPNLDRLATSGHLFTDAWSVTGWTLPAMAAAMTGWPPRALQVTRTVGMPETVPTVAECARREGWWTAGLVANPYLGEEFGFTRGFADFDHTDVIEPLDPVRRTILGRELNRYLVERADLTDGDRLMDQAARWLRDYHRDAPFLLWIHMMDPHMPYRAHPDSAGTWPELPDHPLLDRDGLTDTAGLRAALPEVPAEVRRAVHDLYAGEVRHADRCVGRLLDALAATGHADDTWIVVLSDHGEEFFEHGGFEHGHSLLPEVSGIVLFIRPPGGLAEGVRDDRPVSLLDLVPSLCEALDWTPPAPLPGRPSLLPGPDGRLREPTGLTVLESMLYGPPQQAILRWPDLRVEELESSAAAWYDLLDDPGALVPAPPPADAATVQGQVRELLAEWERQALELGATGRDDAELTDTAKRRLRSLGY